MIEPALKFNTEPIHPNDEGNALLRFRELGFTRIHSVFDPDSVDAYREQVTAAIKPTQHWWSPLEMPLDTPLAVWPARAPRLRQMVRGAFAWGKNKPQICLANPGWLIKPSNPDEKLVHDWHKDDDHQLFGTVGGHYQYPTWIHAVMYFTDMTVDHGPTYVIPRSHRDTTLSPYTGAKEEPFIMNKGDVTLWDQRLWHRASPRKVEGYRIMCNFPFFPVPLYNDRIKICPAQQEMLNKTEDAEEKILFGGPFAF